MQKTNYSVGPKFFGTSAKKSWFDEGDRCSPGPGAHQNVIFNKTNPPIWSTSKDTERDTFLEKYHRAIPSPDRYKVVNPDTNHQKQPSFSVPLYEPKQNPNKIDEGSAADYQPRFNAPKQKHPDYSFGYHFERDYSTKVPPPNAYNSKIVDKSSFNKTQRSFSVSARPPPYGEQGKYPYVGKYNVGGDLQGSKFSIGKSGRPDYYVGAGADNIYNISTNMAAQGKTMGLLIEVPRNKDLEDFPSPDKYNPNLPKTDRNIINYRSKRSQIKNEAVQNNPSPEKYQPKIPQRQQVVSFTKEKRHSPQPNQNPGVGTYRIQKQFQKTLGNMGLKLKKLTEFVNPAPSAYEPKEVLTKPRSQQPINYYSNRTDFSKSVTGKKVGPGVYQVQKQASLSLGKFGKGYKFEPNRNKNPGPGFYEIPSGIGKLPKYCNGPKKLTDTGFSFIELQRQQRIRSERQKHDVKIKAQEQQQQRKLQQLQQKQQAAK